MWTAILAEFLGTFFFISVVLMTGEPIPIVAGLLASIYAFGPISGGYYNPTISAVMYAQGLIDMTTFLAYVFAQTIGGLAALALWNFTKKDKITGKSK